MSEIRERRRLSLVLELAKRYYGNERKLEGLSENFISLWEDGIFLGVMGNPGELIFCAGKGVWKTRTVHRKPANERWDPKTIEFVYRPPWRTSDDDPNADGEMPPVVRTEEMAKKHKFENNVPEEQSMSRFVYLSKSDFDEHVCSSRCPRCRSILKGIRRQDHSKACRQRMQKALEGTERLERAREREHEFYEEVLRREDKKRHIDDASQKESDEGILLVEPV